MIKVASPSNPEFIVHSFDTQEEADRFLARCASSEEVRQRVTRERRARAWQYIYRHKP